jgi:hypothetical protein
VKWVFEFILKRKGFADFFDHLKEAELFSPEHKSGPAPAEDPRYVRIPYWSTLAYLKAVTHLAGGNNNRRLAQKVLDVIHSGSNYRDSDKSI